MAATTERECCRRWFQRCDLFSLRTTLLPSGSGGEQVMVRSQRESTTLWPVEHPERALDGPRGGTDAPRTASSAGHQRIRPESGPWPTAAANEALVRPVPRACSL